MPSSSFHYVHKELFCERMAVSTLAAKYATPLYLYSAGEVQRRITMFHAAFAKLPHTLCYSVKANSNLALLKLLAKLGCGFDVVSGGELERVRIAAPKRLRDVVFSGVGKQTPEIDAAIGAGILIFNIESAAELEHVAARASALHKKIRIALRVNPDVNVETHPYISTGLREHKFGVEIALAPALYAHAAKSKWLDIAGVSVHIGSQITNAAPFGAALRRVRALVEILRAAKHNIRYIDAGGGLGISYDDPGDDFTSRLDAYAAEISSALDRLDVHLLLEPGRSIVAPAGALVTCVLYRKQNGTKRFVIVDAAMNDLIRPSLYQAYHEIIPVERSARAAEQVDVVGPICETGDFFARDRQLPTVEPGELVAILDAGAYGMSLASNYNTRPRAAEILVTGKRAQLIRRRESLKDLLRPEML